MTTHYEVLQVSPDASAEVIKAAYRALQRAHHPDLGGDTQHIGRINHAWEVLSDPDARRRYDGELASRSVPTPPPQPAADGRGADTGWTDAPVEPDWGAETTWNDPVASPSGTRGVADGWRAGDPVHNIPATPQPPMYPSMPGPGSPMPVYVPGGVVPPRITTPFWPTVWGRSLGARIAGGVWLIVSLAPFVIAATTVSNVQLSSLTVNAAILLVLMILSALIAVGRARKGRVTVPYVLWILASLAIAAYVVFAPQATGTASAAIVGSYVTGWLAAFIVMAEWRARDVRRAKGH